VNRKARTTGFRDTIFHLALLFVLFIGYECPRPWAKKPGSFLRWHKLYVLKEFLCF